MPQPEDEDRPPRRKRQDDDYDDDDEYDRPRRRNDDLDPVGFIVPTDVSGWSIVACYAGLIGLCLPFFGVPFAIAGLVCGIVALRKRKKKAISYGRVTSDIRAWIGVTLGGLSLLWQAVFFFVILVIDKK